MISFFSLVASYSLAQGTPLPPKVASIFQDKIGNKEDFLESLEDRCSAYRKQQSLTEDQFRSFFPFKLQNRQVFIFTVGSYSECKTFIALPIGNAYHLEEIPSKQGNSQIDEDGFLMSGFMDGKSVIVAGRLNDYSNYGSAFVARYQKVGKSWKMIQFQHAGFEGYTASFTKAGNEWKSTVLGRTYPQHLSVPHAGARLYMARTFKYINGVLLPTNDVIVPSPMATLDVLVKAGRDGNRPEMKRLCASASVLRKFRLTTSELNDCNWRVGDNGSDNTTLYATEPKLRFRFRNVGGQWKLWQIRHAVHPK